MRKMSLKEETGRVHKAIKRIDAGVPYKNEATRNKAIDRICKKLEVSEKYVRTVGGWRKNKSLIPY